MACQLMYAVIVLFSVLVFPLPQIDAKNSRAEKKLRALVNNLEASFNGTDLGALSKNFASDATFYPDDIPEPLGSEFLVALHSTYAAAHLEVMEFIPVCRNRVYLIHGKLMLYNEEYVEAFHQKSVILAMAVKNKDTKEFVIKYFISNTVNVNQDVIQPIAPQNNG